jgi:integrase
MGVYARPDSKYWWYLIEGTEIRASTGVPRRGGSPAQAKELRRQAEQIYATQQARQAQQAAGLIVTRPTISYRLFSAWYETHDAAHHRGSTKERSMLRQLLVYFGRIGSLADLGEDAVKEWMTWRSRTVSRATVNRELDVLKRVLVAAVPKYLEKSPIAGLRRFRVTETEPRILTPEEEQALLAVSDAEDRAWLVTAIDTLMRLSNVVYLRWGQVKFPARSIVPLNAKVAHDIVPMTTRMADALRALPQDTDWVFPRFHRRRGAPTPDTAAKNKGIRRFDFLCRAAGVPHGRDVDGVTFHCLRHTGATRALQRGASVRTVMKLGGWTDERSVMRYVHAADSDVRAAAESIGARPTHVAE